MDDRHLLEILGGAAAGHFAAIWIGLFVLFAALEAAFGQARDPASADRGRLTVNFGLAIGTALLMLAVPFGLTSAAILAEERGWGLFAHIAAPAPVIVAAALLARTGLAYFVHRASHAIPLLWRLHKVHHTDPCVDVSLGLRHHPLELLPGLAVFTGGVLLLGIPAWAVMLVEIVLVAGSYWEHLDLRLSPRVSRAVRSLAVTPEAHAIHHSAAPAQAHCNFGTVLTIWDRLFKTWRSPDAETVARYGLVDIEPAAANNLWAQLAAPFVHPVPVPSTGLAQETKAE